MQFVGTVKGYTPLPKWYALFNLLIVSVFFNACRGIGNYAIINGIGTSNKSLAAVMMFLVLFVGYGKYVTQKDLV